MDIIRNLVLFIDYLILFYLGITAIYCLVFSLAGLFYKEADSCNRKMSGRFLILIPAYKEDAVIIETAKEAIQHQSDCYFEVIIIADSLQSETIKELKQMDIKLLEVKFKSSTKIKALNVALQNTSNNFDYVLVLDADNIMTNGFLDQLNRRLNNGYRVVQGHRTAKNHNTNIALLDGLSEEINNNIFRKGHSVLGFSAAIIGSGFAGELKLIRNIFSNLEAVGGFDKELEVALMKENIRIGYADKAVLFDEKVQVASNFTNQRRRWLSAQFFYLRKFFSDGIEGLIFQSNFDLFDKVWQFTLVPRIMSIGLLFAGLLLHFLLLNVAETEAFLSIGLLWLIYTLTMFISLILSIPRQLLTSRLFKAMLSLPRTFCLMLVSLFKIAGANIQFLHTSHGITKRNNH